MRQRSYFKVAITICLPENNDQVGEEDDDVSSDGDSSDSDGWSTDHSSQAEADDESNSSDAVAGFSGQVMCTSLRLVSWSLTKIAQMMRLGFVLQHPSKEAMH